MSKVKSKHQIKRRRVTFSFESSGAEEVILMGDFNHWNEKKHPMKSNGNGMWKKSVMILPGRYEYKFLVDRKWKEDPQNDQTCLNGFGTYNNVLNLTGS